MMIIEPEKKHSDVIEKILHSKPKWWVRSGIFFTLLFFFILIGATTLLKEQEVFHADVKLRSSVTIDTIYSEQNQEVVYGLYNGRQVKTGDTILFTQHHNKKMMAVVASKNGIISYPKTLGNKSDVKANDMLYTISSIETDLTGGFEIPQFQSRIFKQGGSIQVKFSNSLCTSFSAQILKVEPLPQDSTKSLVRFIIKHPKNDTLCIAELANTSHSNAEIINFSQSLFDKLFTGISTKR